MTANAAPAMAIPAPQTEPVFADIVARVGEHFANVLYFDLGRYFIAAGVLTALLLIFRRWAKARQIQKRRAKPADYIREILSSTRTVLVFGVTTLATVIGVETGVIHLHIRDASWFTIAWNFALIVVLHDAYFYWIHRAMHTKALFKATHLHHHKSRTPTPWTSYSFTIWEAAAEAAFVPLFLFATSLLGFAFAGLAMFLFLWNMIIRNVMAHAGHELFPAGWLDVPVLKWISTTTHHDLHHSSGHNFGFYFTWWDKWMGTEHPRYREEFSKNAKPLTFPSIGPRMAERIGVTAALVMAGIVTFYGAWAAGI